VKEKDNSEDLIALSQMVCEPDILLQPFNQRIPDGSFLAGNANLIVKLITHIHLVLW
jgi:hypothetical protein